MTNEQTNFRFIGKFIICIVEYSNNLDYFMSIGKLNSDDLRQGYIGKINPVGNRSLILKKEFNKEENENISFSYYTRNNKLEAKICDLLAVYQVFLDKGHLSPKEDIIKTEIEESLLGFNKNSMEVVDTVIDNLWFDASDYVEREEILKKYDEGNEIKKLFIERSNKNCAFEERDNNIGK